MPAGKETTAAQSPSRLVRRRRARGEEIEEEEGVEGKKGKVPRSPIYTRGIDIVGMVGVLHYPDSYCASLPRVGATWGGGSINRATRHVMAVMATVINDKQ
jgi:hypothetical protein